MDLGTNCDYSPIQQWLAGFYNRNGVCLLRGQDLSLKTIQVNLGLAGLLTSVSSRRSRQAPGWQSCTQCTTYIIMHKHAHKHTEFSNSSTRKRHTSNFRVHISRSTARTAIFIALRTETTSFSETLVPTYQMTRYHNPQDNSTYVTIIISLSK